MKYIPPHNNDMHTYYTTICRLVGLFNNPKLNTAYKFKIYNMYVNVLTKIQQNSKHKSIQIFLRMISVFWMGKS